ncbi:MAG: O-antigen ligase family protein [Nitrospirae bacterium]|nr:O-antigen ligase family protein [Nitrospirota bacterium]MCL5237428.1 O-antigen ligase family protein [Nitrospirota bacterium]
MAVLLVISLPFSESLKLICLFLLLFILLIQLHRREVTIHLSIAHYGFIALLLSALISSAFAAHPAKSIKGVRDVLYYTIPFFIACSITGEKSIRAILWGLYASTTAAALFGIFQSLQIHRALEIHALGNSNYTAMYFIIVIASMIGTIIFSDRDSGISKAAISVSASIVLVAAVMTAMRTSFLALFLFVAVLAFKNWRLKSVKVFSLVLLLLVTASVYSYKPMFLKLFMTQSLVSRSYIWQHALTLFLEHPATGIGLNHFQYTFPVTYTPEAGASYFDAHNIYLQIASQVGLPGLFALFLIIFGFMAVYRKIRTESGFQKGIQYSALGGFLVTFVGGIFDTTLHHEHAIVFTLLAGFMFGLYPGKGQSRGNP